MFGCAIHCYEVQHLAFVLLTIELDLSIQSFGMLCDVRCKAQAWPMGTVRKIYEIIRWQLLIRLWSSISKYVSSAQGTRVSRF